jgi:hypothetical protein
MAVEPSVPRWVQVSVGLLLLPITDFCLAASAMPVIRPPEKNPTSAVTLGSVMVLLSFWCVDKAVRLILGWRTHGGLMGPNALRVIGVFFLLVPLAGFITGHYARLGLLAVLQALAYVSVFFSLFALARTRSQADAQATVQADGPASGGPEA